MEDVEKQYKDMCIQYYNMGFEKGGQEVQVLVQETLKRMGISLETFSNELEAVSSDFYNNKDELPSEEK